MAVNYISWDRCIYIKGIYNFKWKDELFFNLRYIQYIHYVDVEN